MSKSGLKRSAIERYYDVITKPHVTNYDEMLFGMNNLQQDLETIDTSNTLIKNRDEIINVLLEQATISEVE